MKKIAFSVASRATGQLQIKPSDSGDENSEKGNLAFITFVYHYTFYSRVSFDIQQVPTSHGLTFLYASIKHFWWLVSPVEIHYRCQCQA